MHISDMVIEMYWIILRKKNKLKIIYYISSLVKSSPRLFDETKDDVRFQLNSILKNSKRRFGRNQSGKIMICTRNEGRGQMTLYAHYILLSGFF